MDSNRSLVCDKKISSKSRTDIWQSILNIKGKKSNLKEFFDSDEENLIRNDCKTLIEKLDNEEVDHLSILSDLESIITTYSEATKNKYFTDNGWLEILNVLLALKLPKNDLYNCFETIHKRYIPFCFDSQTNDKTSLNKQPFHLLRLLLFYHDPELGSFLDTKKINPESYALSWFRSLFAAHCSVEVILALWDVYFQINDPFFIFFLSLVMLVNAKDQIMEMKNQSKEAIIKSINSVPNALNIEDIEDLFYLVEEHYVLKTPKCINEFQHLVFNFDSKEDPNFVFTDLAQALCLLISVSHLLPNPNNNDVRFFIVDCRPADQYNNGHLSTAFHLDCSLMLQEPSAFNTAVQALLVAQRQAIKSGSLAGGKHLCFLGSGKEEEDKYVYMVVASFLQKHHQHVSLAFGGYLALHDLVVRNDSLDKFFVDHNKKNCLGCLKPQSTSFNHTSNSIKSLSSSNSSLTGNQNNDFEHFTRSSIFDKFANVMKSKSLEMKEKIVDYITNPNQHGKHVSSTDKVSRRYRGSDVFSLFDMDNKDDCVQNDAKELEVNIESWCEAQEAIGCFKCEELTEDGHKFPSYLLLNKNYLFVLREIPHNKGYAKIIAKRPLEMVVQITSRKKMPNLITIKYGQTNAGSESGPSIMAFDRLKFSEPYQVTRLVKQQVIKTINGDDDIETDDSKKS